MLDIPTTLIPIKNKTEFYNSEFQGLLKSKKDKFLFNIYVKQRYEYVTIVFLVTNYSNFIITIQNLILE